MGGDAVPEGLDPGGQSLQATGDPAGGVGLEGGPQGPAHRPADGRAHRPAGDEPDDQGQGDAHRCAAWRLAGSRRFIIDTRLTGAPVDQKPETTRAMPTPMPAPMRTTTGVIGRTRGWARRSRRRHRRSRRPGGMPRCSTAGPPPSRLGEDLGRDDVGAVGVLHHPHRGHVPPGQAGGVRPLADEDDQIQGLGGELGGGVVGQVLGRLARRRS